jgi:hypothetical protein
MVKSWQGYCFSYKEIEKPFHFYPLTGGRVTLAAHPLPCLNGWLESAQPAVFPLPAKGCVSSGLSGGHDLQPVTARIFGEVDPHPNDKYFLNELSLLVSNPQS